MEVDHRSRPPPPVASKPKKPILQANSSAETPSTPAHKPAPAVKPKPKTSPPSVHKKPSINRNGSVAENKSAASSSSHQKHHEGKMV